MKTAFRSYLEKSANGNHFFFRVPEKIASSFIAKGHKRVKCLLNNEVEFHCALRPVKTKDFLIGVSKSLMRKARLSLGDEIQTEIYEDNSLYQAPFPEELRAVLSTDEVANTIFEQLTDGKKRSIIYMITSAKTEATRIKRALKITENLKLGITKPPELLK